MRLHIRTAMIAVATSTLIQGVVAAAPKKILIQEFTATWCPHCANAGGGIHQLLENSPDTLVGMMQHFADNFETPLSQELIDFYGLPGHPNIWVDGTYNQIGSTGNFDANEASIGAMVDMASLTTDVVIDLSGAELSNTEYTLNVSVSVEADGESRSMRVYVTQAYSDTAWPEANELQFNTQRQAAPTQIVVLNPGESWSFDHTFTLTDESLNRDYVTYIVWAQDDLAAPPAMVRQVAVHAHGDVAPCPCDGDFDCNLTIDVDDLLHLLGSWGTAGGDADDDGDTDVDDLLTLISTWGDC
jgi:hypothetical protein